MNERIKKIRKTFGLTQQEFSERLNIGRGTLANYEVGRNEPIDAVISLIFREFNINETWLRTGEGEMTAPESSFDLEEYIKRRGVTELEIQILKAYFDLDSDLREKLLQHFKERLTAEQKTPTPVSEDGPKNADEESLMKNVQSMSPGQQELLFNQYNQARLLREQQKGASAASVPPAADDKAPESKIPDPS